NKQQAQNLAHEIAKMNKSEEALLLEQKQQQEKDFQNFADQLHTRAYAHSSTSELHSHPSLSAMEAFLKERRVQIIDRESYTLTVPDVGAVRVFPQKEKKQSISLDTQDIFGRGLDTARAALMILQYQPRQEENALKLMGALEKFQKEIEKCEGNTIAANEALKEFNGAMNDLMVKSGASASHKQAEKSLHFVRDFLWKQTWQQESFCTVVSDDKGSLIRLAKPMELSKEGDAYSGIRLTQFLSLVPTHGSWFKDFVADNVDALLTQSMTPMSRSAYNPGNAYDSSNIYVDKASKQVTQVLNRTHVAITEPYHIKNDFKREQGTRIIHQQLVLGKQEGYPLSKDSTVVPSRLKELVTDHFEQWNGVANKTPANGVVEIPILHQTLVGDGILPWPLSALIPDQAKSTSMLDNKMKANQELQKYFDENAFYCNKSDPNEVLMNPEKTPDPKKYVRVKFTMLDTNTCINQHHKYSRVRDNDIDDSRKLVRLASNQMQAVSAQISLSSDLDMQGIQRDLDTIMKFLQSSDYSLASRYIYRTDAVKSATVNLTAALKDPKIREKLGISEQTANNLALLAQSSAELKCTVHESYFGAARRLLDNQIARIPVVGKIISPIIRLGSWIASQAIKLAMVVPAAEAVKNYAEHHGTRRRTLHKAVNESLVVEALGGHGFGGCMSSADRAEEVEQFKQMQVRAFHDQGSILGFNDSAEQKKEFLSKYGTTQEKHNFNKMSTGTPATQDIETRSLGSDLLHNTSGLASESESKKERDLSRAHAGQRKGKSNEGVDVDVYIEGTDAKKKIAEYKQNQHSSTLTGAEVLADHHPGHPKPADELRHSREVGPDSEEKPLKFKKASVTDKNTRSSVEIGTREAADPSASSVKKTPSPALSGTLPHKWGRGQ
ncbi:MAG TPA: hypothetical protein VHZ76_06125, partial [Gammaproteobacteria bacterium]|nr:hypothetical protein [Gammaproteobacteria bacterium]